MNGHTDRQIVTHKVRWTQTDGWSDTDRQMRWLDTDRQMRWLDTDRQMRWLDTDRQTDEMVRHLSLIHI